MKKIVCYFDLDGVIADFDKKFSKISGLSWTYDPNRTDEGENEMWEFIKQCPDFFFSLEWIKNSKIVVDFVKNSGKADVGICSAATKRIPESIQQKYDWVNLEMPWIHKDHVKIVTSRKLKVNYANENTILVDDIPENVDSFNKAGGTGILFLSPQQVISELHIILDTPVDYYKQYMDQIVYE